MSAETWAAVDSYLEGLLLADDRALAAALAASDAAGLPPIQVSPLQGRLLMLLARMRGARRILEIGTLGGYSTIWLARALPDGGTLISLEVEALHADVARGNLARAGLGDLVDVRVGPAIDSLRRLADEPNEPFDFIFIDADKSSNALYLEAVLGLSRTGTVIVADNVVRGGAILDAADNDATIRATRRFHEMLGADPRLDATVVQTVGAKGYDGFALASVR